MLRSLIVGASLLALITTSAEAATTTTSVALKQSAYTDLGVGPLILVSGGAQVKYQIADTIPTVGSAAFQQLSGQSTTFVSTTSHVWALGADGSTVIVASGTGIGGGGGDASAANQTNGNQKSQIVDGSGNVIASTSNNLNVQCANCSGSGVSTADGATFTAGSSLFAGIGGIYQTSPTSNPLVNGKQGLAQLTVNRALMIDWFNSSGTEIGTSGAPVRVDPTGTTTQPVSAASLPLPTGASTSANQATAAAQASTTSGQTGPLVQGAVTTAAPTYTTAQTDPLSLTTAGALRVDGSAATQPVSGTVTANIGTIGTVATAANQATEITSLSTIATNSGTQATAANQTTGNTSLSTIAGAVTSSVVQDNIKQVNGVTTLTGTGAVGTGAQRIAVGTDTATIAGSAPGTAGSASAQVLSVQGIASMTPMLANPGTAANWGVGATGAAPAANAVLQGTIGGGATGGLVNGLIQADSSAAINVSTATTTQLVALSSGRKIYVTALDVIAGGTGNITFEYGTGSTCGTGTTTLTGAYNLTAQAGISKGGGLGPVLVIPAGNALCVLTSAAVQMSGSVAYAQF